MFYADIPPEQIIVVAAAQSSSSATDRSSYQYAQGNQQRLPGVEAVIGVCQVIPPGKINAQSLGWAQYDLAPIGDAIMYLQDKWHLSDELVNKAKITLTLMSLPEFGKIVPDERGIPDFPNYHPNPTFWGVDRVTYLVEMAGHKVQIEYFLPVGWGYCIGGGDDQYSEKVLPGKIPTHKDKSYPVRDFTININTNIDIALSDLPGQSLGTTVDTTTETKK